MIVLKKVVFVAAGGALGTAVKAFFLVHVQDISHQMMLTLLLNVVGSFALGVCILRLKNARMQLFIGTGFLGGLTTYSSFALQIVNEARQGHMFTAMAYSFGTLALCIGAAAYGMWLGLRRKESV